MNSYVKYIGKRILLSVLTIFAISIFAFLIVHLMPGDPVRTMLGYESDQAAVDALREELNLNKPLPVQYYLWIKGIFQGNFGRSVMLGTDISGLIKEKLPVSLWLTVPSITISVILGIIIGIVCATHRGSAIDQTLTVIMTTMNGIPIFWIGILFIYLGLREPDGELRRICQACAASDNNLQLQATVLNRKTGQDQHA